MKTQNNTLIPIVVEKNPGGFERSYDIYSRLLEDFIVFITGPIEIGMANTFIAQMLFLESKDPSRDISIYINSPGGEVYAGMAMYDTIKHVKNSVSTINVGLAASAGAVLLCAGTKGKRFALPNSYTMIHQVLGGAEGQTTDIEITARHMLKLREQFAQALAKNSGKNMKKVLSDIERDRWMDAKETVAYGIVDVVMKAKKSWGS